MSPFEEIMKARNELIRTRDEQPNRVKCHPVFYDRLRDACGVISFEPTEVYPHTVFGMRIVIDPTMKHGEWKLVVPGSDQ